MRLRLSAEEFGQTLDIRPSNSEAKAQCPRMAVISTSPTGYVDEHHPAVFPPPRPSADHLAALEGPRRKGQWSQSSTIYDRLYTNVDPHGPEMRPGLGRCHVWTGYRLGLKQLHGGIGWSRRYGNTPAYTHRVAWELAHGPIPTGQQINHHCDNGLCVRLDHLYLGTQLDNMRDASARGRFTVAKRSRALTPEQRLWIYEQPERPGLADALAAQFGVTRGCIYTIRRGRFVRPAA